MLKANILPFLSALEENNNREWFNANKAWYQKANKDFHAFVNKLIAAMEVFDSSLAGLDAKDCVFRIYRDVRFSNDKRPFKTHFGAYIGPGGRKSEKPGYYVHVELHNQSIAGGGLYMPSPEILKQVRNELLVTPEDMIDILEEPGFKKYFDGLWGEKLKTAPKGFPKDFEHIDLLKYKGYVVISNISDKQLNDDNIAELYFDITKTMYPFKRLLDSILEGDSD